VVTKEQLKDQIATVLGLSEEENPPMSTGSTEPKRIFELVDQKLNLGLDPNLELTKPRLAKAIVSRAGDDWNLDCESRGGTVTKIGLNKVLDATMLLQRQHRGQRQQQLGYLTVGAPGFPENDYEALRDQGNTGIAAEFGIAASLMAPEQRRVFEVETISHHSQTRRIQQIYRQLDATPINNLCLPGIGATEAERYIYLAPQDDDLGPSDLVVYGLHHSARVGISIKVDNQNIKNVGFAALGLPQDLQEDNKSQIRATMMPAWVEEKVDTVGNLEIIPARKQPGFSCNWDGPSAVKLDFIARTRDQVVDIFNAKTLNERKRSVRSLFHLDNNPIEEFFLVEINKIPTRVKKIIRENSRAFHCGDPYMRPRANCYAEIFDNSGIDPMKLRIQIKFNSRFFEYQERNRLIPEEKLTRYPETYFAVNSPHSATGRFILKYRWLASWDVVVNSMPSPQFWEPLYQVNAR
jgi:hypothetical protein